jgi:hypothetical protein
VPRHDDVQGVLKANGVQHTVHAERAAQGVGRGLRVDLVDVPEAALQVAKVRNLFGRAGRDPWCSRGGGLTFGGDGALQPRGPVVLRTGQAHRFGSRRRRAFEVKLQRTA